MRPIVVTVGPLAAPSANNIAASQTPSGAGDLTLTAGALAGTTPDTPRRVLITTSADETSKTFTVYGTDWNNNSISEVVNGVNATTVYTKYDFKSVTRIAVSAALAGAVTVGTNGVASSRPVFLDSYAFAQSHIQVSVSGTASFTVRETNDNPDSPTNPVAYPSINWVDSSIAAFVTGTATAMGDIPATPAFIQLLMNSNTNPAAVTMTVIQSGSVPQ